MVRWRQETLKSELESDDWEQVEEIRRGNTLDEKKNVSEQSQHGQNHIAFHRLCRIVVVVVSPVLWLYSNWLCKEIIDNIPPPVEAEKTFQVHNQLELREKPINSLISHRDHRQAAPNRFPLALALRSSSRDHQTVATPAGGPRDDILSDAILCCSRFSSIDNLCDFVRYLEEEISCAVSLNACKISFQFGKTSTHLVHTSGRGLMWMNSWMKFLSISFSRSVTVKCPHWRSMADDAREKKKAAVKRV